MYLCTTKATHTLHKLTQEKVMGTIATAAGQAKKERMRKIAKYAHEYVKKLIAENDRSIIDGYITYKQALALGFKKAWSVYYVTKEVVVETIADFYKVINRAQVNVEDERDAYILIAGDGRKSGLNTKIAVHNAKGFARRKLFNINLNSKFGELGRFITKMKKEIGEYTTFSGLKNYIRRSFPNLERNILIDAMLADLA